MQEWGGPVTVAVYIEYKASTEAADACERKVMQYIRETVAELWPSLEAAPATSVSFLYTSYDMPEAACDVELSGSVPAADSHPQPQAGAAQHDSELQQITDSGPHSLPQRLVTNHQQRSLQGAKRKPGSVQQGHSSKPAKPPPLKPVWHFRVRGGSMLKAPSRPWKELYDEFYPVNALRNLAWEQVCIYRVVLLNSWLGVPVLYPYVFTITCWYTTSELPSLVFWQQRGAVPK